MKQIEASMCNRENLCLQKIFVFENFLCANFYVQQIRLCCLSLAIKTADSHHRARENKTLSSRSENFDVD